MPTHPRAGLRRLDLGGATARFHRDRTAAAWLPLMLFVMLFGLLMDDHVFVMSRVREARDAGASAAEVIRYGVAPSAGVVPAAAVVMVGVFSVFGTLSLLGDRAHTGPRWLPHLAH